MRAKGWSKEIAMNPGWKVFWLFAAMCAAALGRERPFLWDVVPVAFADEPQPHWAVQTAFVLRTLELISGSVTLIALLLMLGVWAARLRQVPGRLNSRFFADGRADPFRSRGSRHRPSRSIP